jgi:hypothetical protein
MTASLFFIQSMKTEDTNIKILVLRIFAGAGAIKPAEKLQ